MLSRLKKVSNSSIRKILNYSIVVLVLSYFGAQSIWLKLFHLLFNIDYASTDFYLFYLYLFSLSITIFSYSLGSLFVSSIKLLFQHSILNDSKVSKEIKEHILMTFLMILSVMIIMAMIYFL